MSRVLALIGNRPEVCSIAAQAHSAALSLSSSPTPVGWGVGVYESGQVLLRRRPVDERDAVSITALERASSPAVLAQIRSPGVGALRTENTPPFRFRRWLFAMRGTVESFDSLRPRLLEALPDFLRSNVRGETDGEVLFYSFLSCLQSSVGLERERISPGDIGTALRQAVFQADAALSGLGHSPAVVDCFATNGEHLVALHRSGSLVMRWMDDIAELKHTLPDRPGGASVSPFRCSILLAGVPDTPEHFEPVDPERLVLCGRTEPPVIEPL